jgi:hypothetical protein
MPGICFKVYFASLGSLGRANVPLLKKSYYSLGIPAILQAMIKEKMFLWRLKRALDMLTYMVLVSEVSSLSTRTCGSGEF